MVEIERASLWGSLLTIYKEILFSAEVRMGSRNRVGSFFAGAVLEVHSVFFASALSVTEDEPVRANALFFNKVVNNSIYPIPAELLSSLAGFSIADDSDLTVGIVAQFLGSAGQKGFVIL